MKIIRRRLVIHGIVNLVLPQHGPPLNAVEPQEETALWSISNQSDDSRILLDPLVMLGSFRQVQLNNTRSKALEKKNTILIITIPF